MANDEDIDLWATDEVHFQQHGSRCRMWIPPEDKDPIVLHHPTRKSVGFFGAVRLRDGKLVFRRERDMFNAVTFFAFMKQLRSVTAAGRRRVVVITDNARYHHGRLHKEWREQVSGTFDLEFLPPYSPDMNPIERVWKLTRRQATHNRYFPTLDDTVNAVEQVFYGWNNGNETLRRLCAIT
jgi:transposase